MESYDVGSTPWLVAISHLNNVELSLSQKLEPSATIQATSDVDTWNFYHNSKEGSPKVAFPCFPQLKLVSIHLALSLHALKYHLQNLANFPHL